MTKERRFWFPLVFCLVAVAPLFLGTCLNPLDFNTENLPRIPVDVSGSLDVSIKDVAVFWLINRTKDVDVTSLTVHRGQADNETADQYVYPKHYANLPKAGKSLASYHTPTELYYTVSAIWKRNNGELGAIDALHIQFPRAIDYKYYLYWTKAGDLVLVDETMLQQLPPDPDLNWPDSNFGPDSAGSTHTMVVLNVTQDQGIDEVKFTKGSCTYAIVQEPRARDQEMIYLDAGSYDTTISYTKNGVQTTIGPKTAIVTQELGSMAVKTNFLYFYKTNNGNYQISQTWPPIPNDASAENRPEDALNENQGILEIVNNAVPNNPHALIARILINNNEYSNSINTSSYMAPGDPPRRYILPAGPVFVSFRPTDQTNYGQISEREIRPREVTTLSYINDLGNPWTFPSNSSDGAGLISIENKSNGVVLSAAVYNPGDMLRSITTGYEDFTPPNPIHFNQTGLVEVIGTPEVKLNDPQITGLQVIHVVLQTTEGLVVVERYGKINGNIVPVIITDNDLKPGNRVGSKVTVVNGTSSGRIMGMYVYDRTNNSSLISIGAAYSLDIPAGGSKNDIYILSTTGLPIMAGHTYKAAFAVSFNNRIALSREVGFSPDDLLFSPTPDTHTRTITLTDSDLPPDPFIAVTGIKPISNDLRVTSVVDTALDGTIIGFRHGYQGGINLNQSVAVEPDKATTKSPINWQITGGTGSSYAAINNGVLTVAGYPPDKSTGKTVTVKASIPGAGPGKGNFTSDNITITMDYLYMIKTQKVTGLTLSPGTVEAGKTLDLKTLASLDPSSGANINGTPITPADLEWYINGAKINSSSYTAPASGTSGVSAYAVLPADKNGGDRKQSAPVLITITAPTPPAPAIKPVTSVTPVRGNSLILQYYTKTNGSSKTLITGTPKLDLNASVTVEPSDATNKTINWTLVSSSNVTLSSGELSVTGLNPAATVRATIAGGNGAGVPYFDLNVTPQEHHSRLIAQGELTLTSSEIIIGRPIDLTSLAAMPVGNVDLPNGSQWAITKADLSWEIISGGGSVQSGTFTGAAIENVTLKATLPRARNGGTHGSEVTANVTITVKDVPPPSELTLRIFQSKLPGDITLDNITQVVLIPRDASQSTILDAHKRTGHYSVDWAASGKKDQTYKTEFFNSYLPNRFGQQLILTPVVNMASAGGYVDITIPWPPNYIAGFDVFFIEGDNRVRGYVSPWELNPPKENNYIFYLDFVYIANNFILSMKDDKEVPGGTPGSVKVVPIHYSSYRNVASIMKSGGLYSTPVPDYSDIRAR
jgi:hypothetical protein